MTRTWLMLLLACALAACQPRLQDAPAGAGDASAAPAWAEYTGAWFTIDYPADFIARPSLPSTSASGHDSVFFDAPDGRVQFYVMASQWWRAPRDIALDPARERVVAERTRPWQGGTRVRRDIVARDGSYRRTIELYRSVDGTAGHVFQLRYADSDASSAYKSVYRRFKQSLVPYAD
jgi:hypothetical protein